MIELMVGLSILAISLTIGIPSMQKLIADNRLITATNSLVASLNLARSEAVKQGVNATICTSNDQSSCTASAWGAGWLVWVDTDNDGSLDAPGEIVRVAEARKGTIAVTAASTTLLFDATGFSSTPGTMKVCDSRTGNVGKQLRILAGGGISLTTAVACP